MNTLEGQQEWCKRPRIFFTEKRLKCEENERGAHSETNAGCGHTMEKKKRAAKPKMERCL